MLNKGDKLWSGLIVSSDLAAAYNAAYLRAQSFRDNGLPVPEQLLNGLHNLVNQQKENTQ